MDATTGRVRGGRLLALALALEVVTLGAVAVIAVADRTRIRFELVVIALGAGVALVTLVWPAVTLVGLRTRHRWAAGLALGRGFVALPLIVGIALATPFLVLAFRMSLRAEPGIVAALTIAYLAALAAEILHGIGGFRVWYALQGTEERRNATAAAHAGAAWLEDGERVQCAERSRGKYRHEGGAATYMLSADFVLTDRRLAILTGLRERKLTTELRPEHVRTVSVETMLRMRGTRWKPAGKRVLVLTVHKDDKDATFGIALHAPEEWYDRLQPWATDGKQEQT